MRPTAVGTKGHAVVQLVGTAGRTEAEGVGHTAAVGHMAAAVVAAAGEGRLAEDNSDGKVEVLQPDDAEAAGGVAGPAQGATAAAAAVGGRLLDGVDEQDRAQVAVVRRGAVVLAVVDHNHRLAATDDSLHDHPNAVRLPPGPYARRDVRFADTAGYRKGRRRRLNRKRALGRERVAVVRNCTRP